MGIAVVLLTGAAYWVISLLRDLGVEERISVRKYRDETMFELDVSLERGGHHVRDLTTYLVGQRRKLARLWLVPGCYLLVGLVASAMGVPLLIVAGVVGVLLGAYGAFDELTMPAMGHDSYDEQRSKGEWPWFIVGLTAKVGLAVAGLWVLLSGVKGASWTSWVAVGQVVAGMTVLGVAHLPAVAASRRALRLRRGTFARETDEDSILLLRSFSDDDVRLHSMMVSGGLAAPLLPMGRIRFEEHLARVLKTQSRLVAIGRPGESLPELGAVRTYWPDSQWQEAVRATAFRCRAVVLIAGASDGLAWEIEHLREWGLLGKTLIVLPPDPDPERSELRLRKTYDAIQPGHPPLEGFIPQLWVGLRPMPEGYALHYVADGRDWFNYMGLCVVFLGEFSGRLMTQRHGAFIDHDDAITSAIDESTDASDALARFHQKQIAPLNLGEKPQTYSTINLEARMPVRTLRMVKAFQQAVEADENNDAPAAIAAMRECVAHLDRACCTSR